MSTILIVPDDVLIACFFYLTPLNLLQLSLTSDHFNKLTDVKYYPQMNNYWKHQCGKMWQLVNHKCKKNNRCITKDYHTLFESMVDFIEKFTREQSFQSRQRKFRSIFQRSEETPKPRSPRADAYDMKISITNIDKDLSKPVNILAQIIMFDKVDMFKLFFCYNRLRNMRSDKEDRNLAES